MVQKVFRTSIGVTIETKARFIKYLKYGDKADRFINDLLDLYDKDKSTQQVTQ